VSKKKLRIWFVLIVCTCQPPKIFKDSDSTCDCLSENWQFALVELNSSHYIAVCVEDESRSSDSGNGRLPLGLKVWKTVPFLEDTLVSGTEAVTLIGWVCESAIALMISPDDTAIQMNSYFEEVCRETLNILQALISWLLTSCISGDSGNTIFIVHIQIKTVLAVAYHGKLFRKE